jgi:hypothetical protein
MHLAIGVEGDLLLEQPTFDLGRIHHPHALASIGADQPP